MKTYIFAVVTLFAVGCLDTLPTDSTAQNVGTCVNDPLVGHCQDPTTAARGWTADAAAQAAILEDVPPPSGLVITCDDPSIYDPACSVSWWINPTQWIRAACLLSGLCTANVCWLDVNNNERCLAIW